MDALSWRPRVTFDSVLRALLESPELPGEAGAGGDEAASLAVVLRGAY